MREIINNFDGEIIRHSTSVALFPATAAADLTSLALGAGRLIEGVEPLLTNRQISSLLVSPSWHLGLPMAP